MKMSKDKNMLKFCSAAPDGNEAFVSVCMGEQRAMHEHITNRCNEGSYSPAVLLGAAAALGVFAAFFRLEEATAQKMVSDAFKSGFDDAIKTNI